VNSNDERDHAEEAYWREFCPACGTSPCDSPGGHTVCEDCDEPLHTGKGDYAETWYDDSAGSPACFGNGGKHVPAWPVAEYPPPDAYRRGPGYRGP
jgi:hypothetical protein